MKTYTEQFIGGIWREGSGDSVLENRNPYTDELLYTYRSASRADIDDAYSAAIAAQREWARVLPAAKATLFERLRETIVAFAPVIDECLIMECGSPKSKREMEKAGSVGLARMCVRFPYQMEGKIQPSDTPGQENYIYRTPKGVVCVIAPWNVPFVLALRSVIPAIACGNAVVLKSSSDTPASSFVIAEMFEQAGFPKGVLNVVAGAGREIGDYIVTHPSASSISFTGSTEVGRRIGRLAGESIKDVSLELGGNNPFIVLGDADVGMAVAAGIPGAFFNQGQICMATNRIIVVRERYDAFCTAFAGAVSDLKSGDPADDAVFVGPLINKKQVDDVLALVEATENAGARVLVRGELRGNLMTPWLFADVTNDMPAAANETFGPVCSILRAEDEDDAVRIANETEYGLSSSVITNDRWRGLQVARRIESGMTHVNDSSIGTEPHVMFGGEKASGLGR
ncbi:MAG: aldehyde dehydrogenase family protein, partial [Peptococcaceae bacterium]|nr:aldehyde dehydrogenase family protein [Peptococcaceae bacterium]